MNTYTSKGLIYWLTTSIIRIFSDWYLCRTVIGADNIPKNGPVILAIITHESFADGPLASTITQRLVHFPMTDRFFSGKLVSWFYRKLHLFPVSTKGPQLEMMKKCIHLLGAEQCVAFFITGKINRGGQDPAQDGVAWLTECLMRKYTLVVPIVPVRIMGTKEALPLGARRLRRHPVTLKAGEMLQMKKGEGKSDFSKRIMESIDSL